MANREVLAEMDENFHAQKSTEQREKSCRRMKNEKDGNKKMDRGITH